MPEAHSETRIGRLERLGDSAGFADVVFDILEHAGARRGWTVVHTRAFGGGHMVIARRRGGYEVAAVDESLATAAIDVMSQIAHSIGAVDVQLPLPLELDGRLH